MGHRARHCPNHRVGDTASVDESVYREPPAFGGQDRAALYNEQYGQRAGGFGGFGGGMNEPPAYFNQQQQQPQQQGPMMPQNFAGIPVAPVGQRYFGVAPVTPETAAESVEHFKEETGIEDPYALLMSAQSAREMQQFFASQPKQRLRDRRNARRAAMDIMSVPVLGSSDGPGPAQPQQRQAGRGAMVGARDAQPHRAGAGLLGNHRVERPGAARGQGQQHRQRTGRGGRGGRAEEREEDEPRDGAGAAAGQGSSRGGRSVHTDHPPGFACKVCGGTDHDEKDCAKPSSSAGDSAYCPYHRTISGSEEHADSKCHKCVDKCWEAAVDQDGRGLARAEIDRVVTDFVRSHRGGRPEPRCANIHSHWAMCVSRHIRANGVGGIDASVLPVRRSEVLRRVRASRLSWRQFDHGNVIESRTQFRDPHWECDSPAQLIERLENYARVGTYQSASQRRRGRPEQDDVPAEAHGDAMDAEEQQGSAGEIDEMDVDNDAEDDGRTSDASVSGDEEKGEESEPELAQDYAPEDERFGSDVEDEKQPSVPSASGHGSRGKWAQSKPEEPYAEGGDDDVDFDIDF